MDSSSNKDVTHRQLVSRRDVFGIAAGSALVFSSSAVSAETPKDPKDKAAAIAKQMAVVMFTKKIEEATDKAIVLEKKGKFEEAEKQWNIVIDTYRQGGDGVVLSPQALYRLSKSLVFRGDVRAQLGQQRKIEAPLLGAVDDYSKAIELGTSPETQIKLGTVFVALGRYQEAEERFKKVIESSVGNEVRARAYNNRAIARGRMNKWTEAVADYNEAVQETKGTTEALSNLALAKFQTGDTAGSLTMLQNLMKEMPYGVIAGGEDVPAAIAAVQFASGDKETAQASLKKVDDIRFKDLRYVKEARFWPPKLVEALGSLIAAQ